MPRTDDVTGWTPVEIDTALADIYARLYPALLKVQRAADALERQRRPDRSEIGHERLDVARAAADAIRAEQIPYNVEFQRRGGWTRAFLVTSSAGGHVHSSRECGTCRVSTEFVWLPEYSGADERAVVHDAGERACTQCYPSAPAEVRSRPTRIFSPEERAAQVARDERESNRAAREAVKVATAIANPDGSELRVDGWGLVKTERQAQILYVERAADDVAYSQGLTGGYAPLYPNTVATLLAALAHKRGLSVAAAAAALVPKVQARVRREFR